MKNKILYISLWVFAGIGLLLTILPPILVFANLIDFKFHVYMMNLGMVVWFTARILIQRSVEMKKDF